MPQGPFGFSGRAGDTCTRYQTLSAWAHSWLQWNAAVTTKLSVTDTLNQDKAVLHQQLFLTVNTVEQFTDVVKLNMYVCTCIHYRSYRNISNFCH